MSDELSLPPARLKFEGRSYMLDADERQAFRGVEVVRAVARTGAAHNRPSEGAGAPPVEVITR